MNPKLTQYLSGVLRNQAEEKSVFEPKEYETRIDDLKDPKMNQFLIDGKYALRLDEII